MEYVGWRSGRGHSEVSIVNAFARCTRSEIRATSSARIKSSRLNRPVTTGRVKKYFQRHLNVLLVFSHVPFLKKLNEIVD